MNIITWNVNGLNSPIKRSKILAQLRKEHCDIALLQETHLSPGEHEKLARSWVGEVFYASNERTKTKGVAILIHKKLSFLHHNTWSDKEGRYIAIMGSINGRKTLLLNTYAPSEKAPPFFRSLIPILTSHPEARLVWGGDFNTIQNVDIDKRGGGLRYSAQQASRYLGSLTAELCLVDPWHFQNPAQRDFTHFSPPHNLYSRIDFLLIHSADMENVLSSDILHTALSDHSPVLLKIRHFSVPRQASWTFNNSLLNDPDLREFVKKEVTDFLDFNDKGDVSPALLWDSLKAVLQGKLIAFSAHKVKEREAKLQQLSLDLGYLETEHKITLARLTYKQILAKKEEINSILNDKLDTKYKYIKQSYFESGNRAGKLLAFQIRQREAFQIHSSNSESGRGFTYI